MMTITARRAVAIEQSKMLANIFIFIYTE